MTDPESSVDAFIEEFQATLSSASSEPVLRRINAERLLRMTAEEFAESLPGTRIRFLPDRRMAGAAGADFLLQIDDYDIRLQLMDAAQGKPELQAQQLPAYQEVLEDNPNTVALILVWTGDELPAVPLSVARLRYLNEHNDRLPMLLRHAVPLEAVLRDIVQKQIKEWDLPRVLPEQAGREPGDLRDSFSTSLTQAMKRESQRPYHLPARRIAAERFPLRAEQQVLQRIFDLALRGSSTDELVAQLTRVSQRGGR